MVKYVQIQQNIGKRLTNKVADFNQLSLVFMNGVGWGCLPPLAGFENSLSQFFFDIYCPAGKMGWSKLDVKKFDFWPN